MSAITALTSGLPLLVLHLGAAALLLIVGAIIHLWLTPFRERELVSQGNSAAATVMATTAVALAMPIAATLATSLSVVDILIWGTVGLIVQLAVFSAASLALGNLKARIERGEVAAAITLGGWQIAAALLNSAALLG
jgi:putative membrane protein